MNSGLIIDCGFLKTQILAVHSYFNKYSEVCSSELCMESFEFAEVGAFSLKNKLKELLILDNPGIQEQMKIDYDILQQVLTKMIFVISRENELKYFENEENIEKMKKKMYPITIETKKEAFAIQVSFYTRIMTPLHFFGRISKSEENSNIGYSILTALNRVFLL